MITDTWITTNELLPLRWTYNDYSSFWQPNQSWNHRKCWETKASVQRSEICDIAKSSCCRDQINVPSSFGKIKTTKCHERRRNLSKFIYILAKQCNLTNYFKILFFRRIGISRISTKTFRPKLFRTLGMQDHHELPPKKINFWIYYLVNNIDRIQNDWLTVHVKEQLLCFQVTGLPSSFYYSTWHTLERPPLTNDFPFYHKRNNAMLEIRILLNYFSLFLWFTPKVTTFE